MYYVQRILKQNAYTLFEILVVVIVITVLSSLAIPKFTTILEKTRIGEGLQILDALYKAQQALIFETGTQATTLAGLDVDIPSARYFFAPTFPGGATLASVQRKGGTYTLNVDTNGIITCAGGSICTQIGCPGGTCN